MREENRQLLDEALETGECKRFGIKKKPQMKHVKSDKVSEICAASCSFSRRNVEC